MTYPHKHDIPTKVSPTHKSVTYSLKCDIPLQVWHTLKVTYQNILETKIVQLLRTQFQFQVIIIRTSFRPFLYFSNISRPFFGKFVWITRTHVMMMHEIKIDVDETTRILCFHNFYGGCCSWSFRTFQELASAKVKYFQPLKGGL